MPLYYIRVGIKTKSPLSDSVANAMSEEMMEAIQNYATTEDKIEFHVTEVDANGEDEDEVWEALKRNVRLEDTN